MLTRRDAVRRLFLVSVTLSLGVAQAAPEPARGADELVESIGVCTHWSYPDTPYGYAFPKVKQLLADLGIRYVRDGWTGRVPELFRDLGVRTTVIVSPPLKLDGVKANPQAVAAVEGPNETDIFKFSYNGEGFPQGTRAFQDALFKAVKGDPATVGLPVVAPSVAMPGNEVRLAPLESLDYECMHSYSGGDMPSQNLDRADHNVILNADKIVGRGHALRPVVATECGYHTAAGLRDNAQPGVSERAQAKYIPRLYCEYFNHGVVRAHTYELIDEFNDPEKKNPEAHFGLIRRDLTPKPAYVAARNLIALLKEPGAKFLPQALDFELDGPKSVHHTLLQKSDGDFYLLLWNAVKSFENERSRPNYGEDTENAEAEVALTLHTPIASAATFLPGRSTEVEKTFPSPKKLALRVPDEVMIVRLTPVAKPAGPPPAAPAGPSATATTTAASLKWAPSKGAAGYFVWRMGRHLGSTAEPAFADSGLLPGTGYTYQVAAFDAAGSVSPRTAFVATTRNAFPDLVVADITWSPAEPRPEDKVTFGAVIRNGGDAPSPVLTHGVAFFVDGTFVSWSDTSKEPLGPGQSRAVAANNGPKGSSTWTMTPGKHQVTAYVDDINRIPESNEDNNRLTKPFGE